MVVFIITVHRFSWFLQQLRATNKDQDTRFKTFHLFFNSIWYSQDQSKSIKLSKKGFSHFLVLLHVSLSWRIKFQKSPDLQKDRQHSHGCSSFETQLRVSLTQTRVGQLQVLEGALARVSKLRVAHSDHAAVFPLTPVDADGCERLEYVKDHGRSGVGASAVPLRDSSCCGARAVDVLEL